MLIFLDIDGVLRRAGSLAYQFEPECLEAFETAIRRIPGAEVVITSSWREAFTIAEIRSRFSSDIAIRILGVTPAAQRQDGHYRHREVSAYLERHGRQNEPWIAVDDDPEHYPAGVSLLLVEPLHGFNEDACRRLVELAKGNSTRARDL
jgi:HAD domain in Swiss Army Knife RNA repair proteins